MADQIVAFAFKPGYQVRHITSDEVVTIVKQRVKTTAPGKLEPMYVVRLPDNTELSVRQCELALVVGGQKRTNGPHS